MWAKNQPDNLDGLEHCITVSKKGMWYDELCYLEKNFVCEDLNDTLSFWKACPLGWDLVDKKCYIKGISKRPLLIITINSNFLKSRICIYCPLKEIRL